MPTNMELRAESSDEQRIPPLWYFILAAILLIAGLLPMDPASMIFGATLAATLVYFGIKSIPGGPSVH
jgi:hypothetical protein